MNTKLKRFFIKLEQENPYDYLLIKKFYYSPATVFTKKIDDIENNDYFDINVVYKYMFNNNFLKFLEIVTENENYFKNFDYSILRGIQSLLEKAEELVEINLHNEFTYLDIYKFIKSKLTDKYIYSDKNVKSKMKKYDIETSKIISRKLDVITYIKGRPKQRATREKHFIFDKIENDDYEYYENAYLYNFYYTNEEVISVLYCENKFLNILDKKLLKESLNIHIISNIINILDESIRIKEGNYENESVIRNLIGDKKIKFFNLNKAKKLLELFQEKKEEQEMNKKIAYLPTYK